MNKTEFIEEITLVTKDGFQISLEVHKSPRGGYFAIDSTFLDQVSTKVYDPFGLGEKIECVEPTA